MRRLFIFLIVLLAVPALWLSLARPSLGQSEPPGIQALSARALAGDAGAQLALGYAYDTGRGVGRNLAEAAKWYRLAADQGLAQAQHNLGVMYAAGDGVAFDPAQAVGWYLLAANQGHRDAQFNLANHYEEGQGVGQDFTAAHDWYLKAAEAGLPAAQYNLGNLYVAGQGVARNNVLAYKWISLGTPADQVSKTVVLNILTSIMTPAEVAEAKRLAAAWRKAHSKE